MSVLSDLQEAEANFAAKIKEISANPKPNYSVDGQSVSWAEFLKTLNDALMETRKAIRSLEGPMQKSMRGSI
jgi:hypothetical protein